jgi:hypothetical protein
MHIATYLTSYTHTNDLGAFDAVYTRQAVVTGVEILVMITLIAAALVLRRGK